MTGPQTWAGVLAAAANLVEANGLCHNDWWYDPLRRDWQPGMELCVAAAIGVAVGYRNHNDMCDHVVAEDEILDPDTGDLLAVRVLHPAVEALIGFLPGVSTADELFRWSEEAARAGRRWVVVEALRRCGAEQATLADTGGRVAS